MSDLSEEMGVSLLSQSSLKAGLDINWDDPADRDDTLLLLVNLLDMVTTWVEQGTPPSPVAQSALAMAQQIKMQDIDLGETGTPQLKQGVARNRRISRRDELHPLEWGFLSVRVEDL